MQTRAPDILVFDSGLGGLTVFREIAALRPDAHYRFVADDAVFPYGDLEASALVSRVQEVLAPVIAARAPDVLAIACNTASTLVLPPLRAAYPDIRIVGTVPAVKPAAEQSKSRLISVLATPGTVARDYTRDLVRSFADHCDVELVGAPNLARLAEGYLRGEAPDDPAILAEMAQCFVERDGRRTDHIVLACTHYPLLIERLRALSPWPVVFVDPAPAIARQVQRLLLEGGFDRMEAAQAPIGRISFTGGAPIHPRLHKWLRELRLDVIESAEPR